MSIETKSVSSFEPVIKERLPVTGDGSEYVGWVKGSGGSGLRRAPLGRRFSGVLTVPNGDVPQEYVICETFYPAYEGEKDILFQVAEKHEHGWQGLEGIVTCVVSRKQAETLIFTSKC